jgi:hypothetical protein
VSPPSNKSTHTLRTVVRVHPRFTGASPGSDLRRAQSAPAKANRSSGEPALARNVAAMMERMGRTLAAGDDGTTRVPDDRRNGLWSGANSSTL